jgi:hypothetical protein
MRSPSAAMRAGYDEDEAVVVKRTRWPFWMNTIVWLSNPRG